MSIGQEIFDAAQVGDESTVRSLLKNAEPADIQFADDVSVPPLVCTTNCEYSSNLFLVLFVHHLKLCSME
jgi:hypothetical protein